MKKGCSCNLFLKPINGPMDGFMGFYVGKYTSTMDHLGIEHGLFFAIIRNSFCFLHLASGKRLDSYGKSLSLGKLSVILGHFQELC